MVGSDRAKEALAMMALHETLRNVCVNSEWTYSVFWTIRPRPWVFKRPNVGFPTVPYRRSRGGTGCKVGEENGSLMLMWEDGFCRSSKSRANRVPGLFNSNGNGNGIGMDKMVKSPSYDCLEELDADDPVRKAFRKMSIQLYNYGEGLMGKVASDKCHKWVFKEPTDCEAGISNYWQSSFDAHPPEWTDQFASGIQTIAVIQAGHGLLQLGSCKIIPEDLHFVLRMRHMFESLGYQSGFYLSQLFAGTRNGSANNNKPTVSPRPPLFNWSHRPLPAFPSPRHGLGLINHQSKDESQFLLNNATAAALNNNTSTDSLITHQVLSSLCNQESGCADIKWPNGLSYFTALTTDSKLFFNSENFSESSAEMGLPRMPNTPKHPSPFVARNSQPPSPGMIPTTNANVNHVNCKTSSEAAATNLQAHSHFEGGISEYLSLEGPQTLDRYALPRKMHSGSRLDHKFKRSFTLPARMPSPAQEEHHQQQDHRHEQEPELEPEQHPCTMDYSMNDSAIRHSEVGHIYSDLMETFLE